MVWTPPVFLLVFCPLIINSMVKSNQRIEWNFHNKLRQILSTLLMIVSISECIIISSDYYYLSDDNTERPYFVDIYAASVRLISSVRNSKQRIDFNENFY